MYKFVTILLWCLEVTACSTEGGIVHPFSRKDLHKILLSGLTWIILEFCNEYWRVVRFPSDIPL